MKVRNVLLFSFAILLGFVAVFATQVLGQSYTYKGSLIEPPLPVKDFTLTDQHGKAFRLSDHRGEVELIFFGYTNCPDVCPVTLANFRQIKVQLGDKVDKVNFVFITVDPQRDTAERIGEHLANFDSTFIGLTGDQRDLEMVWNAFDVFVEKVDNGSAAGYEMSHTARVYVVDQSGNLLLTYAFGTESRAMAEDVAHLLDGG